MESIWHQTAKFAPCPPLSGDLKTEAAVIGGGLAGILTAAFLTEAGVSTVVLEANRTGFGQTGNTTAKVTAQHGAIYRQLESAHGTETARLYAQAQQEAVEDYQRLIADRRISCGWERLPAYLYSMEEENVLDDEYAAEKRAGLPVELTEETGLPFPVKKAVRCDRQAQFHPLRLLYYLADGLTIYEKTRVLEAEGDTLRTEHGTVRAQHIVFACHFPFVNVPGYYFLRMHQERSCVAALTGAGKLPGMYYSVEGGLSLRSAGELLLVGGGAHRTGENRSGGKYEALTRSAALLLPGLQPLLHWSAQDCMTLDGIPYIGQFSANTPHWYAVTGFGKWGMTSAMAGAKLLCGLILGREPAFAGLFSPQRFTPAASAAALAENSVHAVRDLSRKLLAPARGAAVSLPPDHGGVVELGGEKVGVYKALDGTLYAVDVRCPHMGCQLEWNPDEKSWDCPCHGSRFDRYGKLLDGPAQMGLDAARQEEKRG